MHFTHPEWLWALTLGVFFMLGWPRTKSGFEAVLLWFALGLGLAGWVCLVLALAGPQRLGERSDLSVAIILDRSSSIDDARWMQALEKARAIRDALDVTPTIVVDREPPVVVATLDEASRLNPAPPQYGSNPRAAVDLALSHMPVRSSRRIAWITDGAMGGKDEDRAFAAARAADVKVFPILVDEGFAWQGVRNLQPQQGKQRGELATATFEMIGHPPGMRSIKLELQNHDGQWRTLATTEVGVAGPEWTSFEIGYRTPAVGQYQMRITTDGDTLPWDDEAHAVVDVADAPVIHIVGASNDHVEALLAQGSANGWMRKGRRYDSLADVPFETLDAHSGVVVLDPHFSSVPAETLAALEARVDDGLHLIAVGGTNEFMMPDVEDDPDFPMRRLLPVHIPDRKKKRPAPLAVVFCIDRSDSMARSSKFDLAIAAVANAIGRLPDEAEVGIIAFNDLPEIVMPLTRLENRRGIATTLGQLRVSGGTSLYPAIEESAEMLVTSSAMLKHVVALSDGQSVTTLERHGSVIEKLRHRKATLSVVGLGKDVDIEELRAVAERGAGQAWFPTSMSELPNILLEETVERINDNAKVEPTPVVVLPHNPLAQGLEEMPDLGGRVEAEGRAGTIQGIVTRDGAPLLASWRRGRGAVTVWMSDIGGSWSDRLIGWSQVDVFFERLIAGVFEAHRPGIEANLEYSGGTQWLDIMLWDGLGQPASDYRVTLEEQSSPDGIRRQNAEVRQVGPGHYRRRVDGAQTPRLVRAEVHAREGAIEGRGIPSLEGASVQLSVGPLIPTESQLGSVNRSVVERVARRTAGKVDASPQDIALEDVAMQQESHDEWAIWMRLGWILWIAALIVRRGAAFTRPRIRPGSQADPLHSNPSPPVPDQSSEGREPPTGEHAHG